jgi:putative protease
VSHLTNNRPELLAPAGDWECLRAAVANGTDAVYFGLQEFNARHRATNFAIEELPAVTDYLHRHNVRGYVTLNTLIFSQELPDLVSIVRRVAEARIDAVIVQDLGLIRLIRRLYPTLPVHASTQTTQTEPRGIEWLRQMGVARVILARELSIREIASIRSRTTMPLEVFVHGALCVAYSGQCLTSEALGGRSANRGQCAQACRMPYDLIVDGEYRDLNDIKYLLSPLDLAGYEQVRALTELGVASFKIEGRLKGPAYVAQTVQTYRRAIDAAVAGEDFRIAADELRDLTQVYSRGFSPGFLNGVNHQQLVAGRFPKSRGVRLGRVIAVHGNAIEIRLDGPVTVQAGDGVVFDESRPEEDEPGGRLRSVEPRGNRVIRVRLERGTHDGRRPAIGAIAWKTDDPQLRARLAESYKTDRLVHAIPLSALARAEVGGAFWLKLTAQGQEVEGSWPGPVPVARNRPTTVHDLREQLGRLGNTPFRLDHLDASLPKAVMIPASAVNRLRRRLLDELWHALRPSHPVGDPDALKHLRDAMAPAATPWSEHRSDDSVALHVLVRSEEQLQAVLPLRPDSVVCELEDTKRYRAAIEQARRLGVRVGIATLRIIKPGEEGFLHAAAAAGPDFVLIRNLAALHVFREQYPNMGRVGDFSLNVANELTADLFRLEGLERLVLSHDLNWEQFAAVVRRIDAGLVEAVVHLRMPMFHNEHCVFAAALSDGKDHRDCGRPCDRHRVELRDRHGALFPLRPDAGCRNTVYNSIPQSAAEYLPRMLALGIRNFRIEFLNETGQEAHDLFAVYRRVLTGQAEAKEIWHRLRALNQLGVTRGTLQLV